MPTAAEISGDPSANRPKHFTEVSGLKDCQIPFDQLRDKSPACTARNDPVGQRCEQYSKSQFPEVVRILVQNAQGRRELCSGTLIGERWILTAAHCIIGDTLANPNGSGADDLVIPAEALGTEIWADNAVILDEPARKKIPKRAIINRHYAGSQSTPPFSNDLALLELTEGFIANAMEPAMIASPQGLAGEATIAGYGYSDVGGQIVAGKFGVTWPPRMEISADTLKFDPADSALNKGGFCSGDSGGPVYSGRARGCKSTDVGGEPRPRLLQGVISYALTRSRGWTAQQQLDACKTGEEMVIQNITGPERRDWICNATDKKVTGC